jgi:hypothetical protein
METKHTPGPWETKEEDSHCWKVYSEEWGGLATLHAAYGVKAQQERLEPDARLIAAAPEMLAACQAALAYFDACVGECGAETDDEIESPEAKQLRAAIAKATGGAE